MMAIPTFSSRSGCQQRRTATSEVFLPPGGHSTHAWLACMSSRRISWCASGSTSTSLASYANSACYRREGVSIGPIEGLRAVRVLDPVCGSSDVLYNASEQRNEYVP